MIERETTFEETGHRVVYTRSVTHDVGVLLVRLMLGVVFLFHGSQKLFGYFDGPGMEGFTAFVDGMGVPYPETAAYISAYTEFFGGVLLVIGFLLRLAVIPMAINMFVACYVHREAFSVQNNGLEYPLTLAIVLLGLGMIGAGRFSVDGLFGLAFSRVRSRRRRKSVAAGPGG